MKIVCKLSEDGFEVEESKIINLNCKRRSNIHFGNKIMFMPNSIKMKQLTCYIYR